MRYLPHTEDDVRRMLATIGADSVEALFAGKRVLVLHCGGGRGELRPCGRHRSSYLGEMLAAAPQTCNVDLFGDEVDVAVVSTTFDQSPNEVGREVRLHPARIQFIQGQEYPCWYDPLDPELAVLERSSGAWIVLPFAALFTAIFFGPSACAIIVGFVLLRKLRRGGR